jgi:ABC-type lipoprotein release transport system permease subunit
MILSISWKNVWRNKARSLIVVSAVTLGTIAGVFVAGLMKGWVDQRIRAAIFTEMGHLKVQNPKYLINEELLYTIPDVDKLTAHLDSLPEVLGYSLRTKVMAMASTARGSAGIILKGIDPEKEKKVSNIFEYILPNSGNYFEGTSRLPQVIISNKTAELLRIKNFRITPKILDSIGELGVPEAVSKKLEPIGNQRYVTRKKFEKAIAQVWSTSEIRKYAPFLIQSAAYFQPRAKITFSFTNANGQLAYQTYQVCGIYKTSNTAFDQMSAFVRNSDLAPAANLSKNQYHEASVILAGNDLEMGRITSDLEKIFPNYSTMTWKELAPDAGMMADFMTFYYYLIMGIIFFALAFGIINTMLMAILERIKELGMLMAIGMKKGKVFQMIMLETVFLTLIGSIVGMLIGALLIFITGHTGLNFSSVAEGFEAVGWSAIVYPSIESSFFFGVTIMVICIAILASIVPAQKALKLKPVEALRIE